MRLKKFYITLCLAALTTRVDAAVVQGFVTDANDGSELPACAVAIEPEHKNIMTDSEGRFKISLSPGRHTIRAVYVGYRPCEQSIDVSDADTSIVIGLKPESLVLGEVTVTARELQGAVGASRIDRAAMEHLQPSSFTDLLELLPGNISKDSSTGKVNSIQLRETGNIGGTGSAVDNADYAISSLGTQFNIDGVPVNTDATHQSVGIESAVGRNAVNRGIDMRSLATDNIESVEIVRGIPSAEYGNLSSGTVNIRRRRSATPWTARFKSDGFSKLIYAGKGFAAGPGRRNTVNVDLGWLDSKTDPRNNLENYKRVTASACASLLWPMSRGTATWTVSCDFTSTVDRAKNDPDLSLTKTDEYRSNHTEIRTASSLSLKLNNIRAVESIDFNLGATYAHDVLRRRLQVAPLRASVAPGSLEAGVHDGKHLLGEYTADYLADGKPFTFYAKAKLSGALPAPSSGNHRYKIGADLSTSKNYGRGQVYDLDRPLSASWTSRPRSFRQIPALNIAGAFVEDAFNMSIGACRAEILAGVHLTALAGLNRRYTLSGKPYVDPRINAVWRFPSIGRGASRVEIMLAGGYGLHTRMPTADYLFPQQAYLDLVQLNYYDTAHPESNSRVNLRTYINDATNYDLRPARNSKYEIRAGIDWRGNSLSVTYFNEHMNDGFRYVQVYGNYAFTRYDASGIDASMLNGPPQLEHLPGTATSVLRGYRKADNGTRIDKRGVEFTLKTARCKPLATALTINGAWFKTLYSNSQMLYEPVGDVVDGVAVCDRYVGLYDTADGRVNEQFNTNFMFDTQLQRQRLVFTVNVQCMWYVKTRRLVEAGRPTAYLSSADGLLHIYDDTAASDPVLKYLERHYNRALYDTFTVPTAVYVNLKATKSIGRSLRVSVFVNRLLDYLPDYTWGGLTVRRNSDAYFGMELNFSL